MPRPLLRSSLVVALVSCVAAVAACGSSSSSSGGSPQQVVKDTFSGKHMKVTSGNIALSFDLTPNAGTTGPVSFKLKGPFESQGTGKLPKFDLALTISAKGTTISAGATSTGDAGFLTFQGQAYSLPPTVFAAFQQGYLNTQSQQKNNPNAGGVKALGINPANWLTNEQSQGSADVGGTSTNHVSASIDVPRLLTDLSTVLGKASSLGVNTSRLPSSLTPQQIQSVQSAIKSSSIDIYSGQSDKILRRLTMSLNIAPPSGKGGAFTFDLQLTGLNSAQTINAPSNPKPLSDLKSALGGLGTGSLGNLLGGASGGASSGGTTTQGSGSPSTGGGVSAAKTQAYLSCIQAAASNTSAAAQCLALLK
jgi:hypothetical protein